MRLKVIGSASFTLAVGGYAAAESATLPSIGLDRDLLHLLQQSGPVGWSVLATLILLSVFSWAVMAFKWRESRACTAEDAAYLAAFRQSRTLKDAQHAATRYEHGSVPRLFLAGYSELARQNPKPTGEGGPPVPRRVNIRGLERELRRAQRIETARLRRFLTVLATTASVSPFIGLFGTVWGIMNAFQQIGAQASANLAVVAPGIAEALVATAAGLGAAIPAVLGYNYFNSRLRNAVTEMENFSLEFITLVENIALREGTLFE